MKILQWFSHFKYRGKRFGVLLKTIENINSRFIYLDIKVVAISITTVKRIISAKKSF